MGGAAAVEFAMVATPFFFVIGGILEVGIMLFTEYTLQFAVQEASRQIRTGQSIAANQTLDQFKDQVCSEAPNLQDCTNRVAVYVGNATQFTVLEGAAPDPLSVTVGANEAFLPGGSRSAVAVFATYDWDFLFPFMGVFSNLQNNTSRRLQGVAVFMNEPF